MSTDLRPDDEPQAGGQPAPDFANMTEAQARMALIELGLRDGLRLDDALALAVAAYDYVIGDISSDEVLARLEKPKAGPSASEANAGVAALVGKTGNESAPTPAPAAQARATAPVAAAHPKNRPYTDEDDAFLKAAYPSAAAVWEIAAALDRSPASVRERVKRLGLTRDGNAIPAGVAERLLGVRAGRLPAKPTTRRLVSPRPRRAAAAEVRVYTEADLDFLVAAYPSKARVRDIAKVLGRSFYAIRSKTKIMGLHRAGQPIPEAVAGRIAALDDAERLPKIAETKARDGLAMTHSFEAVRDYLISIGERIIHSTDGNYVIQTKTGPLVMTASEVIAFANNRRARASLPQFDLTRSLP